VVHPEQLDVVVGARVDRGLLAAMQRGNLRVFRLARSSAEALVEALLVRPAAVLLDVDLDDVLPAVHELASSGLPVAVRGALDDHVTLFAALAAGARGYLDAAAPPSSAATALAVVAGGGVVLPRAAEAALLERFRSLGGAVELETGERRVRLTQREWDVLLLLRQGCTTEEMASRLYVSKPTVRTFVSALLGRFGVHDRDALLATATGASLA
jgi:DNA-binding NarL/FixJ family response regulator